MNPFVMKNNMYHLAFLISLGLTIPFATFSQSASARMTGNEKSSQNKNTKSWVDYSADAESHTEKLKEDLQLSPQQAIRIRSINELRASKLNEAFVRTRSDKKQWHAENTRITDWANEEYKNIMEPHQFENYTSKMGKYKEFKFK